MARRYCLPIAPIAMATARDIFSINNTSATVLCRILRWWMTCGNLAAIAAQNLTFSLNRFTAAVVVGTGGGATTPQLVDGGNPASVMACRSNDFTTQMAGGTTAFNEYRNCFVTQGIDCVLSDPLVISPAEGCSLKLTNVTVGGVILGGGILFEEIGGAA
jgi:hypothetical protein